VAIRQNLPVSSAAIAVAHQFPTSLNPTVSIDARPWTFVNLGGNSRPLEMDFTISWNQPVQLGHRRAHREAIARAAFSQTQWNVLHAELSALVQTYRLHQTATYRREKLRVSQQLADFNEALVATVRRQMQANQASAADVSIAEVENQTTSQQLAASQQDLVAALTELRQQMGIPEYADSIVPSGELRVPEPTVPRDAESLIRTALGSRPEIQAAAAQVAASRAAVCLARADRIPVPSVGPVYEKDEAGVTFYGFAVSGPVPILNAGGPLVRQREAEYHRDMAVLEQTQQRIRAQVRAALVKWSQVQQSVARVQATMQPIQAETARMERLYKAGQTDLIRLLQVRGRLIQAENAQLDAIWQATQAYADLLTAVGCTPLLGSLDPEVVPPADSPRQ
jgi:cobalt-zinc-cadmium efflux system outer membrane protein